MKDLMIDKMSCIVDTTYMYNRIHQKNYQHIWKQFLICDTFDDVEFLKFYNIFMNLFYKQM